MNITIVGAGNMGLCLLGFVSLQGHCATLYTNSKKLEDKTFVLKNTERAYDQIIRDFKITSSKEEAFKSCDIVFCTYPAFLRNNFIREIEEVINPNSILCFVPGYGGAEYSCGRMIERGVKICGFQRVPYVARFDAEKEKIVANILSEKKQIYVASIPKRMTAQVAKTIEGILRIETIPLKEYLAVTLSPSNPLLHISGIYNVFAGKTKDTTFPRELKFYEEWNDSTSELLMEYDTELHRVCSAMSPYFNLDEVVPLSTYYESPTPEAMTKKLKSIEPFKVVKVPLKRNETNTYVVDLDSRMFAEDFPFGVCMFKAFALMTCVETPIIDKLLSFYKDLSGKSYFGNDSVSKSNISETNIPQLFGINSVKSLFDFYSQN